MQLNSSITERAWELFGELNKVPRPSHNEEKVADYLCRFAERNQLDYDRDAQNCVVMRKPATTGLEDREPLVLLNHMDMVCVADPGTLFNPLTDPIKPVIKDGWMSAEGTSLGADNGIGLSIALAIMEDRNLKHGPLEMLTTTNEEDGMTGAAQLAHNFIKGRKVLNLDSEDYDTLTIGAAGAYMQTHCWTMRPSQPDEGLSHTLIEVRNGLGGHSGVDINKGRGNAIKLLGELLSQLSRETTLRIGGLTGGSSTAAIATTASATIATTTPVTGKVLNMAKSLLQPYAATDGDLAIEATTTAPIPVLSLEDSKRITETIHNTPNGALAMRADMPQTVMTSSNMGMLRQEGDRVWLTTHTRSFANSEMERIGKEIADLVKAQGGKTTVDANSPAWAEDGETAFVASVSRAFEEELGFTPKKVAMHFVLEAGYLARTFPGIEIACIGPRIVAPHSTKERVEMKTVEDVVKVVRRVIEQGTAL